MVRKLLIAVAIVLFAVPEAVAQAPTSAAQPEIPAATRSDIECSGFISADRVANTVYVSSGADDDLVEPLREFIPGDFVYLLSRRNEAFAVGAEYSVVRPETGSAFRISWSPGQIEKQIEPPNSWYPQQKWSIRRLGHRYADAGRVKVIASTPDGAVAQVEFACGPINNRDIALPYQDRPIPAYRRNKDFNRFAQPMNALTGKIVAGGHATGFVGQGDLAYLNLGEKDGAHAGQRYRIYATYRQRLLPKLEEVAPYPATPHEAVGELVILTTQKKSSVARVVGSVREVFVGDMVQSE